MSAQGQLQAQFFDLVDFGLSAEELKTVCKKAYAELARLGVTLSRTPAWASLPASRVQRPALRRERPA